MGLMHHPPGNAGDISDRQRHPLATQTQLSLAAKHHEKGFMGMAMALIGGPRRDPHQTGVHHLQAHQREALHTKVNAKGGVDVLIERGGLIPTTHLAGELPAGRRRDGGWSGAWTDLAQQVVDSHQGQQWAYREPWGGVKNNGFRKLCMYPEQ